MKLTDFYYDLPEKLIAQSPLQKRDNSRLMTMNKITGEIQHMVFSDIVDLLNPGDALILNNSRVIPARMFGNKVGTGANIEVFLLTQHEKDVFEVLVRPGRKVKIGDKIDIGSILMCTVLEIKDDGNRIVKFDYKGDFYDCLYKVGKIPLPPYIKQELADDERYQTVYAKDKGSVAAPTAGLHFTNELLDKIKQKGVSIGFVTLHVGLGTFRPVKVDDITEHKMHSEHYHIPKETADLINSTKKSGGRIVCVGTTSARTLEAAALNIKDDTFTEVDGWTDIFIYPGKQINVVDALITNFHLPESTLLMLVSALSTRENIINAYNIAVENEYRFFSFGDAMFIY